MADLIRCEESKPITLYNFFAPPYLLAGALEFVTKRQNEALEAEFSVLWPHAAISSEQPEYMPDLVTVSFPLLGGERGQHNYDEGPTWSFFLKDLVNEFIESNYPPSADTRTHGKALRDQLINLADKLDRMLVNHGK